MRVAGLDPPEAQVDAVAALVEQAKDGPEQTDGRRVPHNEKDLHRTPADGTNRPSMSYSYRRC